MIKYIFMILLSAAPCHASLVLHCENDFDLTRPSNVKRIHAVGVLWRIPHSQETKYSLDDLLQQGGKQDITNKIFPERLTFYAEYYYGDVGQHMLVEKVLDISKIDDGCRFKLYNRYYDEAAKEIFFKEVKTWERRSIPTEIYMRIVNDEKALNGIDITIEDNILIDIPK